MGTYAELQNRIVDEMMARSDLKSSGSNLTTTRVQYAILDAVKFWEDSRFFFNEYRTASAFSTVAAQEFYTSSDWADIATIAHIDKLTVLISGSRFQMTARTAQYLEDVSISPTNTGQPSDYAYYNEQLRFYPIPDGAYPVNVLGTKQFTALSADADSNVWTTDAESLIRQAAKKRLWRDVLLDSEQAAICERAEQEEASNLRSMTFNRMAPTRLRPTAF